jgi:hypothetical protein
MSDSSITTQFAEAVAWCQDQTNKLIAAIGEVPGPFAKFPFPEYGAICQRALTYGLYLGAGPLVQDLGADLEGAASMAEAFRQVRLLADWLATKNHRGKQELVRKPGKGKRGRPPGSKTEAEDLKLYSDWQAANTVRRITKAEFLRERGLPKSDLSAIERGRKQEKKKRKQAGKK